MYESVTPKKFYKKLHMIMAEQNISTETLRRDLKLGENTFYRWAEFFPRVETIMKIADYLGVSVDELLIGKEYKYGFLEQEKS